jgi:hypothetical protein
MKHICHVAKRSIASRTAMSVDNVLHSIQIKMSTANARAELCSGTKLRGWACGLGSQFLPHLVSEDAEGNFESELSKK